MAGISVGTISIFYYAIITFYKSSKNYETSFIQIINSKRIDQQMPLLQVHLLFRTWPVAAHHPPLHREMNVSFPIIYLSVSINIQRLSTHDYYKLLVV